MDIVGIVNISMVKCLWFMDVYGRHAVDGCEIPIFTVFHTTNWCRISSIQSMIISRLHRG